MGRSKSMARRPRLPAELSNLNQEEPKIPIEDISNTFLEFLGSLSNESLSNEPPRKRQRLSTENEACDSIIVNRSKLVLKLPNERPQDSEEIIELSRVPILVTLAEAPSDVFHTKIYDISSGKFRRLIFDVTTPADNVPLEDIQIATLVATEALQWQNTRVDGRLWTETNLRLGRNNEGITYLELGFTLKWATITSINTLPRRRVNRPALQAVLDAYYKFPGEHYIEDTDPWLPQNFYDSVHIPDKEDEVANSIVSEHLSATLYPFQKRTVRWLLERERVQWSSTDRCLTELPREEKKQQLPYSFYQTTDYDNQTIYISPFLKVAVKDVEPFQHLDALRGGMICEEMGLGKTVEIIALITLHKRPPTSGVVVDPYIMESVRPTAATLIITPPSILSQWISELDLHAPGLRVMHYEGIKAYKQVNTTQLVDRLASHDVILTTYNVLSSEVHYTLPPPDRRLRGEKKHARPKSPLVQLSWWRVCLDEAQMIENGLSNAATVARLIPRTNAWAVTGTPVQKDVADLYGLLIFLRLEPFLSVPHLWLSLVTEHRLLFKAIFKQISLRHTKRYVRDELRLPGQQRFVITIPFTPIEEQHYQSLFQQMCEDCGVNAQGSPLRDDWDPDEPSIIEQMRTWLVRLRQTALHPEVGGRNRRALGHKLGTLRTVEDVLAAMLEQSEVGLRTDQRALLLSKLKRGQTLENRSELEIKQALDIWTEVLREASQMVSECREQLQTEILSSRGDLDMADSKNDIRGSSDDESHNAYQEDITEVSARIGTFRNRLRAQLEIQHAAKFFQSSGYFQLKSNEDVTKLDSLEFKELEKLEIEGYEKAKEIRQEILKDIFQKVNRMMTKVSRTASTQAFVQIPEFLSSPSRAGIESRRIMEQLNELGVALDAQANNLDEWRERTIKLLTRPLVDEDEGMEITGDEYEESTKTQDEVMVLVQALRTMIEDRHDALTGQENLLIKGEAKNALKLAQEGEGAYPEKVIELFKIRDEVKPSKNISARGVISQLRAVATNLKIDAENGSGRADSELAIVEQERQRVQKQYNEQSKAIVGLRQEIDSFTGLMNIRLEYYRQLQQLSDMVAPLEEGDRDKLRNQLLIEEEKITKRISTSAAKRRYLIHLRNEATADQTEQRMCVICQSTFEIGALTVCGHQFCKECMGFWWRAHHNCPVCKRKLTRDDLHDITYKPQELRVAEEVIPVLGDSSSIDAKTTGIYSEISSDKLREIKNIELDGPSFTTKIDCIARHLLWLRESDPGAKSIIFSQFKEFLEILGRALSTFRVGFTTIDMARGVENFKQDPVECFLLHAKAHSSGLNLVNASHVFLCEPLINTALELQAIARVHRIGQKQATTIWLYIIDGTVEESIYRISVRRRLEHMSQYGKGKSRELTPEMLDTSNSLELQNASLARLLTRGHTGAGEVVNKNDLWSCLFGKIEGGKHVVTSDSLDAETKRHLDTKAAEV